ncbi:MAG: hypothetical protein ACD_28C00278G0010 [uncultured bacterium]|nr:MAG: hypothetical protein ACD_28C00278G0010 [uncultured bacterium]KKT76137.1 MAG: hypothetical protein UW70_C0021G0004 [Candidatus Peregrinibacteria bacterium GW2011_GWA2_44_7]
MDKNNEIPVLAKVGQTEKPLFGGFSKLFYETEDPEVLRVVFKDVMHGRGKERKIEGTGRLREEFCFWFYRVLEREGIRTHIAEKIGTIPLQKNEPLLEAGGMLVKNLDMIALELIYRTVARGNWVDAHKFPVLEEGAVLTPSPVEFCLKWKQSVENLDYKELSPVWKKIHAALSHTPLGKILLPSEIVRDDPRIGIDIAVAMNSHAREEKLRGHLIQNREEGIELEELTRRVNIILVQFMEEQGWFFEDGKFEVGVPREGARQFLIADEYTQDSCRVRKSDGTSLTKDLHRQGKSDTEIYDGYAQLTEAMKQWAAGR